MPLSRDRLLQMLAYMIGSGVIEVSDFDDHAQTEDLPIIAVWLADKLGESVPQDATLEELYRYIQQNGRRLT